MSWRNQNSNFIIAIRWEKWERFITLSFDRAVAGESRPAGCGGVI